MSDDTKDRPFDPFADVRVIALTPEQATQLLAEALAYLQHCQECGGPLPDMAEYPHIVCVECIATYNAKIQAERIEARRREQAERFQREQINRAMLELYTADSLPMH